MDAPWFGFGLGSLACWRLAHLLAYEDGPWDVLVRLRRRFGSSVLGRLMDCFYCVSLWVALPFGLLVGRSTQEGVLAWLAMSGAACLLERVGHQPVTIAPYTTEGEDHELLRQQAGGTDKQAPEQGEQ